MTLLIGCLLFIAVLLLLSIIAYFDYRSKQPMKFDQMLTVDIYRRMLREWFAKYPEYWIERRRTETLNCIDSTFNGMLPTDAMELLCDRSESFKEFMVRMTGDNLK